MVLPQQAETVERAVAKVSWRNTLGMLRSNRPLATLCLSALLFLSGMFAVAAVAVYCAGDVLRSADLFIAMTIIQTGCS